MAISVGELEASLSVDSASFINGMRQASGAFSNAAKSFASSGQQAANAMSTHFKQMQETVSKGSEGLSKAMEFAGGMAIFETVQAGAHSIASFAQQAVLGAARGDQMNRVLEMMGKRAGITTEQVHHQIEAIRRLGIEEETAQNTLQNFIRYQMDYTQAAKLARVAQNAAVMENTNSSEALDRLIWGIQTQNTEIFRTAGLMINVGGALETYAKSVGKTTSELTSNERAQATLNAVIEEGKKIEGAYEVSLGSSMKTLKSMERVVNDIQTNIGNALLPAFDQLVKEGLEPFLMTLRSATGEGGSLRKFFEGFGQALTSIAQIATKSLPVMVGSFEALGKVVGPLISSFATLAGVIAKHNSVMTLMGVAVGMAIIKKKLLATAIAEEGKSLSVVGQSVFAYQKAVQAGATSTQAFGQAAGIAATGVKISFLEIKAAALSLASSILPLLAITAVAMAFEKFSQRNADAKKRTDELTQSLKEQLDVLLKEKDALITLGDKGLGTLNDALVKTGKEGEETTNALLSLGKHSGDYAQTMLDFKKNTEAAAYALAKKKGFTDEDAKAMAHYVATHDKGKDSWHRGNMEMMGFSKSMIEATMNLEQLDDASENTNFPKLTKQIIDTTVRTNEATQALKEQAQKYVENEIAHGKKMTADEKAMEIYNRFIDLSARYQKRLNEEASALNALPKPVDNVYNRMKALFELTKEKGTITTEEFTKALLGAAQSAKVNASKAYFDMGVALNDFNKKLKESKGNQNALTAVGWDFMQMLSENSAQIHNLGGTLGDVDAGIKQLVDSFYKQGEAAGWSKDQLDGVLKSMGIIKANGDIVLTIDVETGNLQKALKIFGGLGGADALAYANAAKQLADLNDQKRRNLNLDIQSIDTSTKAAGAVNKHADANKKLKKKMEDLRQQITDTYETALENAKTKLDEATAKQTEFSSSISDAIKAGLSMSDAFNKAKNSVDEVTAAQNELNDANAVLARLLKVRETEAPLIASGQLAQSSVSLNDYLTAVENVTKAQGKLNTAQANKTDFVAELKKQYNAAMNFGDLIKKLRAANLNEAGIRQIMSAGVDTGTQIADALLQGGADTIAQANTWYDTLDTTAKDIGDTVSKQFYQSGVDTATAMVNGITDTWEALKPKLAKMTLPALQFEAATASSKIAQSSPDFYSTMGDWATAAANMALGSMPHLADGGIVNKSTVALVGERGPEAILPLSSSLLSQVGSGGDTINITVNAGMGSDGTQIGRQIVDELVQYQRTVGTLPLKIQGMK